MIRRRDFLKAVSAGAAAMFLPGCANHANKPGDDRLSEKPNIVIIVADDLGWNDVGYHGSDIRTPSIDRLAGEGVELDRYYVCPVCSPTRAGLMTGRYPLCFGMQSGVCAPPTIHGMPPQEFTLPEMLADAGYSRRASFGKWHLGHASTMFHPLRQGFTCFYGHYNGALDYFTHKRYGQLDWHRNYESCYDRGYTTDLVGDEAVKFIRESKKGEPFFLYVPFNAPHSPIQAKTDDLKAYGFDETKELAPWTVAGRARREGTPDYGRQGRGNTCRQTFSAMVTAMDRQIGRIFDALDERGLCDNTIVLFHSDNGADPSHGGNNKPLRGKKGTTWEGGVRVAAAIRWPARIPGGRKFDGVMGYIDILPTLAEAAGYTGKWPNNLDGVSMLAALEAKGKPPDRTFYLGKKSVVKQNWKLVNNQLFAIDKDPFEKENVSVKHPHVVERLKKDLQEFEGLAGPKFESRLVRDEDKWPPSEWKLPEE
ncbi:MAG: sulfatase-like hydrolase/transferase [Planctomycetota bacterium]|jgi:arylsulfatase B